MIESRTLLQLCQSHFGNGESAALADLPREKGGRGEGFGPHELLEAALATCITMTVQLHAQKQGWPLREARCIVRIDRADPMEAKLEYRLEIDGPLTPDQLAELRRVAGQCPVSRTLTHPIRIDAAATS
ncbi:MAG: OsmC family protein [Gemmataceae bacterium]|nr:OsmC family protein [Gemmataceae bacterium]